MTTRANATILSKAPQGRHICQFHRETGSLADAVGLFAGTGLQRGDVVILIATPEHLRAFYDALRRMQLDPDTAREDGQLIVLDAHTTLDGFMRNGTPDWALFRRAIGSVLETTAVKKHRAVRAYGEMVSLLWREGNPEAAIRLEEYWNELSRIYPFTLFCAYMLDGLDPGSYDGPLHEIGRTHTDVLGTEEDERLRAAIDAASEDVLGLSFSLTLSFSGREQTVGVSIGSPSAGGPCCGCSGTCPGAAVAFLSAPATTCSRTPFPRHNGTV
jgi:hypothetical protein